MVVLLDQIEADRQRLATALATIPEDDAAAVEVELRGLLRLLPQLDGIHRLVATYRVDVGRQDLPVGLMHLVDRLVDDLLPSSTDPLIHLDSDYMYSTLPLVAYSGFVLHGSSAGAQAQSFPEPHPVAFNLPALDPSSALLAPILAHEVGHAACREKLINEVAQALPTQQINDEFQAAAAQLPAMTQAIAAEWSGAFRDWFEELLCDAVATALTGPSFLFALSVFLPAPAAHAVGSHPHERDRIGFCLRLLDQLGWTPFLETHVREIYEWCADLAGSPVLDGTSKETFLRAAMTTIEPLLFRVATEHVTTGMTSDQAEQGRVAALELLALEVPPVAADDQLLTPWQVILYGWLSEIARLGSDPQALVMAVSNRDLNAFLTKTIELAGIARLWSETAP